MAGRLTDKGVLSPVTCLSPDLPVSTSSPFLSNMIAKKKTNFVYLFLLTAQLRRQPWPYQEGDKTHLQEFTDILNPPCPERVPEMEGMGAGRCLGGSDRGVWKLAVLLFGNTRLLDKFDHSSPLDSGFQGFVLYKAVFLRVCNRQALEPRLWGPWSLNVQECFPQ